MYKKSKILKIIRKEVEEGNSLMNAQLCAGLRSTYTLFSWRKRPLIDRYISALVLRQNQTRVKKVEWKLYEKALEGNLTAIIFFLTNRAPEDWADRRNVFQNNFINKQGANGSFNGEDREFSQRVMAVLGNKLQE
jgi:hypothetical protein